MVIRLGARVVVSVLVFLGMTANFALAGEKGMRAKKVKWVKSKDGLKALIELSKSMGKSAEQLKEETRNYDRARKAASEGELKKGETVSRVAKTLGEPVVILSCEDTKAVKWVYKPGNATFFDYKKVYLNFDENGELVDWKVVDGKRGESEQ